MDVLECAGNACRQYCKALRSQGVAVETNEAGCNVPAMFTVREDGVTFEPTPVKQAIHNADLVEKLGGTICRLLIERTKADPEKKVVGELTDCYGETFSARMSLWQAMFSATRDGRQFTDTELQFYQGKLAETDVALHEKAANATQEAVLRAQAIADCVTLKKYRLLFDGQMVSTVNRLVGNTTDGKPTLLLGDKGIAKTQVAKFVAKLWDPKNNPVIISGHGDMMSNELIGQIEQDEVTRAFSFKEGKLVTAMREGRPVIIDEVNVGDQSVVMRLQDILLCRPGERISIQENSASIEIQPGFVIIATANEASARYQHRNVLDAAFRDRFDIINLRYPDSDTRNPVQDVPQSLMRLALASAVDEQGFLSRHVDPATLELFVRLSHVTQQLYSGSARDARVSNINTGQSTSSFLGEEPAMTDCITPRTVVDTVQRIATGNKPGISFVTEINRVIASLDQAGSAHNQTKAQSVLKLLQRSY